MSNNFDGPVLLDSTGDYFGFGRSGSASTGPRLYTTAGDPNGAISAPRGSIALDSVADFLWQNTDGATTWQAVGGGIVPFGASVTVYVSTLGNDSTGDGSVGSPFASIQRALLAFAAYNATECIIMLVNTGATPGNPVEYPMPTGDVAWMVAPSVKNDGAVARVRITGDTFVDVLSGTITTDNSAADGSAGWALDDAGSGWTVDAYRGKMLIIDDGARAGVEARIYRNDADTLWANPVYTTSGYPGNPGTAAYRITEPSCRVVFSDPGDAVVGNIDFQGVDVYVATPTSNGVLALGGDVVRFARATVTVGTIDAGCRKLVTDNTYMANVGVGSPTNAGGLHIRQNCTWQCGQSFVYDGVNGASTSTEHIKVSGHWDLRCCAVFRELGTQGVLIAGGEVWSGGGEGDVPAIAFDDCDVGLDVDNLEGAGSSVRLSALYNHGSGANGVTTIPYIVRAKNNAYVNIVGFGGKTSPATGSTGLSVGSATSNTAVGNNSSGGLIVGLDNEPYVYADPGTGNILIPGDIDRAVITLNIGAGAETNTLPDPGTDGSGLPLQGSRLTIVAGAVGGGTRAITASTKINNVPNTVMTFTAVDQVIELVAITDGTGNNRRWQVAFNDGVTLS